MPDHCGCTQHEQSAQVAITLFGEARGVKMGRKPKLTPHLQAEAVKRRETGEPIREIACTYNVRNSTISRL
jgi:hypothetical protein